MQGLILAAGMGKRLGKHTQDQTKCMVKVKGKTLIEYTLDALSNLKMQRVIIVIGYCGDKLKEFIGNNYKGMEIIYVTNDNYDTTNNIVSLWLASKYLIKDDTILLESDLIFEESILKGVIDNPNKNLAVVSKFEPWMDGTVTLLDDNNKILNFIPKKYFDWSNSGSYYKTVNIYKFSQEFSKNCYMPFLEAYVKTMGKNEYYEQVLRVITYLEKVDLKAHKLENEKWYEIDDIQDLDIAEILFADGEDELKLYQRRYGGYWRFPKIKDFCYLVNPYFPNKQVYDELKASFEILVSQYPSGLNIQNLLAAKLFGCEPSEILVGNGASELISSLISNITGDIGIIYPTFNEYPERIGVERLKKFTPKSKDFSYQLSELKEFSRGLAALVLINPDNPSGAFLTETEVIELIEHLNQQGIKVIVDESFVDFAQKKLRFSLISSEVLQKYQNLIVIKSISKSYGVPGLRLGVLACGDQEIITKVRRNLSIWNINSLGEYFLQIIGKYKSDYEKACQLLEIERNRFLRELTKISFIKVIPSQANYFLCEVVGKYSATELTEKLLSQFNILIKDCSGKPGFENGQYVRIAVKNFDENNSLIAGLRELEILIHRKQEPSKKIKLPKEELLINQ